MGEIRKQPSMLHSRHSCVDILRYVTYILVMTRKMLRFFREHGVSGPTRKGDSRINMLELANEGLREINILLRLEVRDLKQRIRGLEEAGT